MEIDHIHHFGENDKELNVNLISEHCHLVDVSSNTHTSVLK